MKLFLKRLILLGGIAVLCVIALILINKNVTSVSRQYIYFDEGNVSKSEVALILGAKVFNNGRLSDMLKDRADTAIDLYKNGKADKILMSGDHGAWEYDEVNAVKNYLLEKGIKGEDIFLDHAGFDTYDSLYRAKEIFQARTVIVVSQNFHLPRAVYIGRSLGIEAYGVKADKSAYQNIEGNIFREIFANVKAFFDVSLSAKPKYLGEVIPISGDGRQSWD